MAWGVAASYGPVRFAVHFEKFALKLYLPDMKNPELVMQIVTVLQKCCGVAESYLSEEIESQLASARVTIKNQYHRFDDAYQFFRQLARNAYASEPPGPGPGRPRFGSVTTFVSCPHRQGGYLASAMLDAYFSKLEHVLVLMSAFSSSTSTTVA